MSVVERQKAKDVESIDKEISLLMLLEHICVYFLT